MRVRRALLGVALPLLWLAVPAAAQQVIGGGGGSGGGGISSVTAGLGIGATAGTCGSGSGAALFQCNAPNTQTGNYTVLNADGGKTVNCNAAGGCTFTLPQATASGNFALGWSACFTSQQGNVTLTPVTSTIYAIASLTFVPGQIACVQSDGTNYLGSGGGTPATVATLFTTTAGRVVNYRLVTAAGAVTAAATDDFICIAKTTPAATVVNLPASPTSGQRLIIKDCGGNGVANNYTITPAAGNIDGAGTFVINTNYGAVVLLYGNSQWSVVSSR